MAPAKKATPAKSLKEILANSENETPEETDPVVTSPEENPASESNLAHNIVPEDNTDSEGNPRVETNLTPDNTSGRTDTPVNEEGQVSTVPVWRENPEHNLGKIHPDVTPQPEPQHQTQTSRMVYVTDFAQPAELDDKGLVGPEDDEVTPHEGEYTSEYAPPNKNDDKGFVSE